MTAARNDVERPAETAEQRAARLAERVRTLPTEPGCYLMRGADGDIFYVGKAASLRARVRSYFSGSDTRQFVEWLGDILWDIDYVVVRNEKEALLLERTLIRQHQPRFNVLLRDDKNFIHLRLDVRAAPPGAKLRARFPRVEVVRGAKDDGARYFGPYHSATGARQALRVLNRYFQLRTCKDTVLESRTRPCLQHQIGRCPAPCVYAVPDYGDHVAEAALFLAGRRRELEQRLRARMLELADAEAFEGAARVRDQLGAVGSTLDDQAVSEIERRRDVDVLAVQRQGSLLVIVRLVVRDGHLLASEVESFDKAEFPTPELVASFLAQLYLSADAETPPGDLPDEILTSIDLADDAAALEAALAERAGHAVAVRVPQRGHGRRLLEIAEKNAAAAAADLVRKADVRERGVASLQRFLSLPRPPRVIECFDVSLFQGTDAVASQVCFVDGAPDKSRYRRYNIRTVEGTDDYAMMHEALVRRLKKGELPDLLLVDGGKGQLQVALAACKDTGTPVGGDGLMVASIAKARSFSNGERPETPREEREHADAELQMSPERVFLPGIKDPFALRAHTAERFLVEQVRDEAHRFAITGHRGKRKRRTLRSRLDDIRGVGPKKRKALLSALGSVEGIKAAPLDEIAKVVGPALAERILLELRRPSST
ncbi:MAG: excinuclease ABC subunit UvrC [Deltaproteobacteria bacterium]|nr:excinuclease ABC subunit UvrC [Deltaproteobacteria bacterium]